MWHSPIHPAKSYFLPKREVHEDGASIQNWSRPWSLWPALAKSGQKPMPLSGFLHSASLSRSQRTLLHSTRVCANTAMLLHNNVVIEYRWWQGNDGLDVRPMAGDLVGHKVERDQSRAGGTPSIGW